MAQSIEPNIAELANGWLKSYKIEQNPFNSKIEKVRTIYEKLGKKTPSVE